MSASVGKKWDSGLVYDRRGRGVLTSNRREGDRRLYDANLADQADVKSLLSAAVACS